MKASNALDDRALASCSREPIHIPGAIQPHGTLLSVREVDLVVRQVSENIAEHLGLKPEQVLDRRLTEFLDREFVESLRQALAAEDIAASNPLRLHHRHSDRDFCFDAVLHRALGGVVIIELEPSVEALESEAGFIPFYRRVRDSIGAIQASSTVERACKIACEEIQRISGFGRVMAYRFDTDWHGTTVAEAVVPGMASYYGQRFPASDIPEQARRLYTVNWMRLIANREYVPSRLRPELNPETNSPLDLSQSVLRSVSPVHLEYLKNMGDCAASMSVSVVKEGVLWALIACHHPAPRHLPYQVRVGCEFIGRLLSHHVTTLEVRDAQAKREALRGSITKVMAALDRREKLGESLVARANDLLAIGHATGAAVCSRAELKLLGKTPSEEDVKALIAELPFSAKGVFYTDHLTAERREATKYLDSAAGVMGITTTESRQTVLLWFRPEVIRTVTWAGDPHKPIETESGGSSIHPRRSFAAWQQTVRERSTPWEPTEIEAANEFRNLLVTEELARTNDELAASNRELDNYGYIVSHDLKEPVRGIRNYISFLRQDHENDLVPAIRQRLDQVVTLTRRMDELLDSLFHYSRMGRVALAREQCDLNDVLQRVRDSLSFTLESEKVKVEIPRSLPRLPCDRARVGEIFFNLILNGIKYNESDEKVIEVGWNDGSPRVFYVRDNGIGIAENHREAVFRIFKRLHARDKYGGGTGSGLAIVKRIAELHGGKVWVDSTPGKGSTFHFTLERDDAS